jgi:hypothetical protein
MKRTMTGIMAAALAVGGMMQADTVAREVFNFPKPSKPRSTKLWTCRKCGNKFSPNVSNSLCDGCIRARDGES